MQLGSTKDVRHYVNFVIENSIPRAISKEEIGTAKETDKELQKLTVVYRSQIRGHKEILKWF